MTEPVNLPGSRKNWRGRILLLGVGAFIGLAVAEGCVRMFGIAYPLPYYPDPIVGTRLKPGFAAWFSSEGSAYVKVNRAGFRDRERQLRKPPGSLRIAVLGDSYCEALQVNVEETFWWRLEQRLNADPRCKGHRIEVLNFGISGHGTAQQLRMLEGYAWNYDPDLVVLAFVAGNDVRNNSPALEPEQRRPFYRLHQGQLELDDSFRQDPAFLKAQSWQVKSKVWLINHCHVLQVVNRWRTGTGSRASSETIGEEAGISNSVYREPADPAWIAAWQVTEAILDEIHQQANARHVPLIIATIPNAIQVHPDPAQRQSLAALIGVEDLDYAERRISAWGQSRNVPVVPLTAMMKERAEKTGVYWHGFANTKLGTGHWNAAGHACAALLIAETIASRHLLQDRGATLPSF